MNGDINIALVLLAVVLSFNITCMLIMYFTYIWKLLLWGGGGGGEVHFHWALYHIRKKKNQGKRIHIYLYMYMYVVQGWVNAQIANIKTIRVSK